MCWFSFLPQILFMPSSDVPALKISILSLSHGWSSAEPPSISKSRKSNLTWKICIESTCLAYTEIIIFYSLTFLSVIIKNSYLIWHIVSSTTGMLNRHNVGFSPDCGYSSFWKYTISSALLLCWLQLYSTTWNLYRKFIQYSMSQNSKLTICGLK